MLHWAVVFFILALIVAFLGFGGVAKVLFFGFLIVAVVALLVNLTRSTI